MAYSIGQFRRSQLESYATALSYTQGKVADDSLGDGLGDIELSGLYNIGLTLSSSITSNLSYYLRFKVLRREDSVQKFTITLVQTDSTDEDNAQDIRNYTVAKAPEGSTGKYYTTFELIFHPNNTYNQILFDLTRIANELNITNDDGSGDDTTGRIMDIEVEELSSLVNVVSVLSSISSYEGLTTLKKIGIQGPPGLMFVLDGEEMRIGRTGIYELYNDDITISYLGFVIKKSDFTQDGKDFFILDFKY